VFWIRSLLLSARNEYFNKSNLFIKEITREAVRETLGFHSHTRIQSLNLLNNYTYGYFFFGWTSSWVTWWT